MLGDRMAGPVQPLLPDFPSLEEQERRLKQGLGIVGLIVAARVAPQTTAPVLRFGFGIVIAPETGALKGATPLALTNLLPFPFGFAEAKDYGLSPNYYLPPGTSGKYLPDFVPGIKEQRAEFESRQKFAGSAIGPGPRAEREAQARLAQMTLPQLQSALTAQGGRFARFPGFTAEETREALAVEIRVREVSLLSSKPAPGVTTVAPPVPVALPRREPIGHLMFDAGKGQTQSFPGSERPGSEGVQGLNFLSPDQLRAELGSLNQSLFLELKTGATIVEVETTRIFIAALEAELASRLAPAPSTVTFTQDQQRIVTPAPIGPVLPGTGGAPAIPTGPSGQSQSPSPRPPTSGPVGGPLVPPTNYTPGGTQGQPNWPKNSPDPSGPFPDVFVQHRAGDP